MRLRDRGRPTVGPRGRVRVRDRACVTGTVTVRARVADHRPVPLRPGPPAPAGPAAPPRAQHHLAPLLPPPSPPPTPSIRRLPRPHAPSLPHSPRPRERGALLLPSPSRAWPTAAVQLRGPGWAVHCTAGWQHESAALLKSPGPARVAKRPGGCHSGAPVSHGATQSLFGPAMPRLNCFSLAWDRHSKFGRIQVADQTRGRVRRDRGKRGRWEADYATRRRGRH